MEKLPLSVAFITKNEEDRLYKTLEAIYDIASEIIVIDSGSSDNTINIAKEFNAKVYEHEWLGFVKQKNLLIDKCNFEYILFLDADEIVTESLKEEIARVIKDNEADGYLINRKTHYLGKLLHHAWQPNYRLRLVKKSANPLWKGEIVHEELTINGHVKKLANCIEHYSYRDIFDHYQRTIYYARLSAQSYIKKGKKPSIFKLLVNPTFSFIKLYFIKLGFLDGFPGLVAGVSAFIYTFLKYAFLFEATIKDQHSNKKKKEN